MPLSGEKKVCQYETFDSLKDSYLYAPRSTAIASARSSRWDRPIARLLAAGYSFLPCQYQSSGYLYRAMSSGLGEALSSGCFGHFEGTREECQVEKVMDIHFVTHEISDALTASDHISPGQDNGIIVFPASHFNEQLNSGNAAVLAIGDSGMVFRYPLLSRPLFITDVTAIITCDSFVETARGDQKEWADKLIPMGAELKDDTTLCLNRLLKRHSLSAADMVAGNIQPRKTDLD